MGRFNYGKVAKLHLEKRCEWVPVSVCAFIGKGATKIN